MTLGLMLVNGDSDYLLMIHCTALCALYVIYLIFITTPGNQMVIPYLQKEKTKFDKSSQVHS